jgi:hypothetical protein
MAFLLLSAAKEVIDCVMSAKDLSEYIVGDRITEQLDLLREVEADTASQLLKEARNREGEARRLKLDHALIHLESAYTAVVRRAEIPWWRGISAVRGRADAFELASHIAFLSAVTYVALQVDPISARERLLDAERWYLRRSNVTRKNLESDRRIATSGRSAGRGNPLPSKIVASNIARANARISALDNEIMMTKAIIAEALITLDFRTLGERGPWRNAPQKFSDSD